MDLCDKGVKYESYMRKLKMPLQRMEYLDKVDKELDRKFIEIYNNLTELYKEKPF